MSPEVTVLAAVSAPVQRQFPAVDASHSEMCEYVSDVETSVQVMSASDVTVPDDDAPTVADLRVVSPAAFDVPASPGSPMWSLT